MLQRSSLARPRRTCHAPVIITGTKLRGIGIPCRRPSGDRTLGCRNRPRNGIRPPSRCDKMNDPRHLPPPPERFNIARYCLAEHAAARPDKTALIVVGGGQERRWCYGELDRAVRRLAGGLLGLGLSPGARLMIRMDNDLPYILTFFAALAAGLVPLPSSAALTGEEAEFLLNDSGATALVLSDDLPLAHDVPSELVVLRTEQIVGLSRDAEPRPYAETTAEDPAFLIYTSGTIGQPKGVLHGHRSAWGRRPMYQGWYGIGETDIVLHAGAFNWTYTLGVGMI